MRDLSPGDIDRLVCIRFVSFFVSFLFFSLSLFIIIIFFS